MFPKFAISQYSYIKSEELVNIVTYYFENSLAQLFITKHVAKTDNLKFYYFQ